MDSLTDILKRHIGYSCNVKSSSVSISYLNGHYYFDSIWKLYISFGNKEVARFYIIDYKFHDSEYLTKYAIIPKEIGRTESHKQPVKFNNNHKHISAVEVYKRKVGFDETEPLKYFQYPGSEEKYEVSPELYAIKFENGEEIVIYFDHSPGMRIYFRMDHFIADLAPLRDKPTFDDFERVL